MRDIASYSSRNAEYTDDAEIKDRLLLLCSPWYLLQSASDRLVNLRDAHTAQGKQPGVTKPLEDSHLLSGNIEGVQSGQALAQVSRRLAQMGHGSFNRPESTHKAIVGGPSHLELAISV